jgi:hypothetical protein
MPIREEISKEKRSIDLLHLDHLVAEMVNHFDRDAAGFRLGEWTADG